MKNRRIILTFLLALLLMCTTLIFASAAGDNVSFFAVGTASAHSSDDTGAVKWYKGSDNIHYLLLPSNADRTNLTVWFNATADVKCGDTVLKNGEATSVFAEGSQFILTCADASYSVRVMQATASGAIYINTESGSMDAVHADKSHKEGGTILIVDKDGNVQYDGDLDYIKGRGNSTWLHAKKPYNIKLDSKADLFGMGKHKSWCLLANHADASMMRNQLAYDLARKLGIETTSQTFQNELYINGEYMGLYLITEKVDIGENRVDIYDLEGATEDVNEKDLDEYKPAGSQNSTKSGTIKYAAIPNDPDEITGGYLLELEKIYRYPDEVSGFVTKIGQAVVVKTPEYATKNQVKYISSYYQDFEDALYSKTGYNSKGKHYSDYIDVDSLARMYIMLEFTANFDGCSSSFYLYKDVGGKLTAGPCWDYDLSLGTAMPNELINNVENVADPNLLYIQTCHIGNHAKTKNALLAQAFSHYDFQTTVEQIWRDEFEKIYPEFRSSIDTIKAENETSVIMNSVKWNTFGTQDTSAMPSHYAWNVSIITNYVDARFPFLSEVYSADTFFVKYDIGKYGNSLVKDTTIYREGDKATLLPAPDSTKNGTKFIGWTTSPADPAIIYLPGDTITVTDNTKLFAVWDEGSEFINSITNLFEKLKQMLIKIMELFGFTF